MKKMGVIRAIESRIGRIQRFVKSFVWYLKYLFYWDNFMAGDDDPVYDFYPLDWDDVTDPSYELAAAIHRVFGKPDNLSF